MFKKCGISFIPPNTNFCFLNGEKLRGCGFHRYVFAYVRSLSINETQDERERERERD